MIRKQLMIPWKLEEIWFECFSIVFKKFLGVGLRISPLITNFTEWTGKWKCNADAVMYIWKCMWNYMSWWLRWIKLKNIEFFTPKSTQRRTIILKISVLLTRAYHSGFKITTLTQKCICLIIKIIVSKRHSYTPLSHSWDMVCGWAWLCCLASFPM